MSFHMAPLSYLKTLGQISRLSVRENSRRTKNDRVDYELDAKQGLVGNLKSSCTTGYGGAQNRVGNANPGQARQVKCYNCNGIGHIARNNTQPKQPQNSEYFKDKMLLMQAQENGVALDEEQLLFLAADDCDAFDSDIDEAPMAQTMFMANLSFADPVYDEVGPSYDSNILCEVYDYDQYQDAVCEHHEEHEMHVMYNQTMLLTRMPIIRVIVI
ncbi:retrovirus-related pol polyprotein from transposon TNT 1-94 [Tanacetum coccineum]